MHHHGAKTRTAARAAGFTLTELLLVVAIIALVGGMSGGLYVGTHKKLLVEKTARQFLLMARYARIMAIEQQRPYALQVLGQDKGFALTTTQANPETGQAETTVVRDLYCRPVRFEGDVKFEDVKITTFTTAETDAEEQGIVFLPNGSAQSAVVQFGDGRSHYTVAIVAATGKATMYFGAAEAVKTAVIDLDTQ